MATVLQDPAPPPGRTRGRRTVSQVVRLAAAALLIVIIGGIVGHYTAPSVHVQVACPNGQTYDKQIRPGGSFATTCGVTP